jgi:hypothetical protein
MNNYPRRITYGIGQRFHYFIVLRPATHKISKNGKTQTQWFCLCDCGVEFVTTTKQIQKGRKSCGCKAKSKRFKPMSAERVIGNYRFNQYKSSGIPFSLTLEQCMKLIFGNCEYCGSPPYSEFKLKKHLTKINVIDRVNTNLGYEGSNCVSCCVICRRAKNAISNEEFYAWICRITRQPNKQ